MNGWTYRARTIDGEIREGVVQAITPDDAMRALVRGKLIPEWVRPAPKDRTLELRRRPKAKALAIFARQMATLIDAAVPLVGSLDVLEELTEDRPLRRAVARVKADVQAGQGLAEAMRSHPKVFTDIFVNMIEAGEEGGVLDTILLRLANYLEKNQALVDRVKTAMVYPAIIVLVAVAAVAVMLTFVVPTFEQMFASAGLALPLPTLILVNSSAFLRETWAVITLGTLGGFLLLRQFHETDAGRRVFDAVVLRLPVLGDLARKAAIARFSRTAASLLAAGVNLLEAFEAAARSSGNTVIERAIVRTRPAIAAGRGVAEPLSTSGVVPKLVSRMIQVGEETGRLDDMFEKIADFYEGEVESAAERVMKALEPALIVLVGGVLGGMVVAMYLPIFEALTGIADAVE